MSGAIDLKKVAPLSLYGLSLMWSSMFGTSESVVFPSLAAYPQLLLASRVFNLLAFGMVMGIVALLGDRARPHLEAGILVPFSVVLGIAGMAVGSLAGMGIVPVEVLPAAAFARGVFYGVMTIAWINVLVHLDGDTVGAAIAAALVLYALAGLAMVQAAWFSPVLCMALLCACPVLSYLGCDRVRRTAPPPGPVAQEHEPMPLRSRWKLYVANLAFGVMLGSVLYYFALYDTPEMVGAFLVAAIALLVAFLLLSRAGKLYFVFRMFLAAFAASAAALAIFGVLDQPEALLVVSAVLAALVFYTVVIFMDTQGRMRSPFWRTPGICQVFAAAGMIMASVAFQWVFPKGDIAPSSLLILSAACALFIASTFSPTARTVIRPWGFSSLVPEESPEVRVLRRCGELATERKLTTRELEILQQLARGASVNEIATALVMSPATAKTHVRNIYAKLGVHSKKELESLISD